MTRHFRALLITAAAVLAIAGVAMMRANDSIEEKLDQTLAQSGDAP